MTTPRKIDPELDDKVMAALKSSTSVMTAPDLVKIVKPTVPSMIYSALKRLQRAGKVANRQMANSRGPTTLVWWPIEGQEECKSE